MRVNKTKTFLFRFVFCFPCEFFFFLCLIHTVLSCHRHRPLCSTPVFGGNRSNFPPWRHGNGNLYFSHCWDPNGTSGQPQVGIAGVGLPQTSDWRSSQANSFNREILGREEHWPLLLSTTCVPAILQLSILVWFPESPRYLFIDKKDEVGCKKGNCEECSD